MNGMHKHHRKRRSQGGDDSPENIILLPATIHEAVHRNVSLALAYGLLVPSWEDPAEIRADVPGFIAALEGRTPVGNQEAVQGGDEPSRTAALNEAGFAVPTSEGRMVEPMQTTVDGDEVPHSHVIGPGEKPCPKCKGRGKVAEEKPKEELEQAPERKKTTWSVRVPKDERENGYELLESLMESSVERMHELGLIRDKNKGANYYTLILALRKFILGELD